MEHWPSEIEIEEAKKAYARFVEAATRISRMPPSPWFPCTDDPPREFAILDPSAEAILRETIRADKAESDLAEACADRDYYKHQRTALFLLVCLFAAFIVALVIKGGNQ